MGDFYASLLEHLFGNKNVTFKHVFILKFQVAALDIFVKFCEYGLLDHLKQAYLSFRSEINILF